MAKRARQPGAQPPGLMASPVTSGWMQFVGLILTALSVGVAVYSIPTGQPQASGRESRPQLQLSVLEEDLHHIKYLHLAIDDVAKHEVDHDTLKQAERTIGTFLVSRADVLQRYGLSDSFETFYRRFTAYKDAPNAQNKGRLIGEIRRFAAALDAAKQRIARIKTT
jgi:hypothetical protein